MQWYQVNITIAKGKTGITQQGNTKPAAPCLAYGANDGITWAPKGLGSCLQHT